MNSITRTEHSCTVPVIAGVEITTDAVGRFNLNALHRASSQGAAKAPNQWLRTKQAQELIEELTSNLLINSQAVNMQLGQEVISVVHGGTLPGTFAHEILAVEYAGWISPAFRIQVNQTFLDYRTGKLAPVVDPIAVLNDPVTMRGLLLNYSEKVLSLESKVEKMQPDVDALSRIAKSDGSLCLTDAAKTLQVRPKDLTQRMSLNRWIYKRPGNSSWIGYQDKIQQGLVEHKVTTVERSDGTEKTVEQVRVTPKGLTKLSQMLGGVE